MWPLACGATKCLMNAQEKALLLNALTEAQKADNREALDKRIFRNPVTGYEAGTEITFGANVVVKEATATAGEKPYTYPAVKAILNGKVEDINLNKVIRANQALTPPDYGEYPLLGSLSKAEMYQDLANMLANKTIVFNTIVRLEFEKFQAAGTVWRRCTLPEEVE